MDTTETYINMSDCPEVQEQRPELQDGDYISLCGVQKCVEARNGKVGVAIFCPHLDIGYHRGDIWLPRQDQVQAMLGIDTSSPVSFVAEIYTFCKENYRYSVIFTSMEQLWLAFYIHTSHNKVWNGEKWEAVA